MKGDCGVAKSEANTGARGYPDKRRERIEGMLTRVRMARDDAQKMDLAFEAYLLEMASMALNEQLLKCPSRRA